MEKVWDELKKIESKAEQIQKDAVEKSKQIAAYAEQKADQLVANAKTLANEEAQYQRSIALKDADELRIKKMTANNETMAQIKKTAKARLEKAADKIVNAVVGEIPNASNNEIR